MLWQRAFTKDILSIFLEYKLAHPQLVGWAFFVYYSAFYSLLLCNYFFSNVQFFSLPMSNKKGGRTRCSSTFCYYRAL